MHTCRNTNSLIDITETHAHSLFWGERKFQREQVGGVIAIYQDDF